MSYNGPNQLQEDTEENMAFDASELYPQFLTSPMFKLITGPSHKVYYVQKGLLETLSPELRNHITNEMKEGKESSMTLEDVLENTMEKFLQWAYTGSYVVEHLSTKTAGAATPPMTIASRLLTHARLYVFADRFNIAALRAFTFNKLVAILGSLGTPEGPEKVLGVIKLLEYAFDNLPLKSTGERLLDYLCAYGAWTLEILRKEESFWDLVESNADFAQAMLRNAKLDEAAPPPWIPSDTNTESASGASYLKLKTDFVCSRCDKCKYQGAFLLKCRNCSRYDMEFNNETGRFVDTRKLPPHKLEGRNIDLRRQCPSCRSVNNPPYFHCPRCLGTACIFVD